MGNDSENRISKMECFMELYGVLPRAGPGDNASTRRAYDMLQGLPPEPRILDLGCGPGVQTLEIARLSGGRVVALDLFPQMIKRVKEAAVEQGMGDRIETLQKDMNEMNFDDGSFDVVWAEGAIYFMGFRNGLARVKRLVKEGGFVAVTEAVWIRPNPPEEVVRLWLEYPEIATIDEKLKVISELGYTEVGHFLLPDSSWTEPYYDHLERRIGELEPAWKGNTLAMEVIREARFEMEVFRKHHEFYGYCFFVMRK